jgi:hypothetical protein
MRISSSSIVDSTTFCGEKWLKLKLLLLLLLPLLLLLLLLLLLPPPPLLLLLLLLSIANCKLIANVLIR